MISETSDSIDFDDEKYSIDTINELIKIGMMQETIDDFLSKKSFDACRLFSYYSLDKIVDGFIKHQFTSKFYKDENINNDLRNIHFVKFCEEIGSKKRLVNYGIKCTSKEI